MIRRNILPTLAVLSTLVPSLWAQSGVDAQRMAVPISDPSKPVELHASLISGSITVRAHDGDEVIVTATPREAARRQTSSNGMRLIPNNSIGVTAEEDANRVDIGADWSSAPVDLEILVPTNTSAELSTVNSGNIVVTGLNGELELQNTNGAITAEAIRGSVVAHTTNGPVRVTFDEIDHDRDMAFNSFNGDVDVTFPPSLDADIKISAGRGEIRTDFDAVQQPVAPRVEQGGDGGKYRVRMSQEVHLKIGKGGPTYRMKTFNGNVFIRKGS